MNPSVIIAPADNIRMLLNNFTDILGIPIVTFLKKYPYILLKDASNIKRLLMSFKQYGIPDKYVKNYMKVFMINNEVFQERIKMLKCHPHLKVWYEHPRMVQIICQMNQTKHRMKYIDIVDSLKWIHPQTFLSSKAVVEK